MSWSGLGCVGSLLGTPAPTWRSSIEQIQLHMSYQDGLAAKRVPSVYVEVVQLFDRQFHNPFDSFLLHHVLEVESYS